MTKEEICNKLKELNIQPNELLLEKCKLNTLINLYNQDPKFLSDSVNITELYHKPIKDSVNSAILIRLLGFLGYEVLNKCSYSSTNDFMSSARELLIKRYFPKSKLKDLSELYNFNKVQTACALLDWTPLVSYVDTMGANYIVFDFAIQSNLTENEKSVLSNTLNNLLTIYKQTKLARNLHTLILASYIYIFYILSKHGVSNCLETCSKINYLTTMNNNIDFYYNMMQVPDRLIIGIELINSLEVFNILGLVKETNTEQGI